MKKLFMAVFLVMLSCGIVFAGGDQNQGTTGTGATSTGADSQGSASQDRSGR